MNRSDYAFADLSLADYETIVSASEMDGNVSPMHGATNHDALIAQSRAFDVDPRVLLAATHLEDHDGTDPGGGLSLARVFNFAGIKWAGQPGAYDSNIKCPPNEGGTYAGFFDLGGFAAEFYRTLLNQWCGDAFRAGDLAGAFAIYVGGPRNPNHAAGQARVEQWQYYQRHYPSGGTMTDGIAADAIADEALRHMGEKRSGSYDTLNGDHYWCNPATNEYFCESFVERVHEHCNVSVVPRDTAADKGRALRDQGFMHTDGSNPPRGSVISLDEKYFSGGGHTAISLGDRTMVGTCSPEGIGIRPIPFTSPGYMGWSYYPGVVATAPAPTPAPVPTSDKLILPDTPRNKGVTDPALLVGMIGGFKNRWAILPDPLTLLGYPLGNEADALVFELDGTVQRRRVQYFQRGVLIYQPEQPKPWDVVTAFLGQVITPL